MLYYLTKEEDCLYSSIITSGHIKLLKNNKSNAGAEISNAVHESMIAFSERH